MTALKKRCLTELRERETRFRTKNSFSKLEDQLGGQDRRSKKSF